jgi:hypothetical protein
MTWKVINNERSGSYKSSKDVRAHMSLVSSCGPLQLPLVTFLGVVWFVLLRSFQRYWWCHHWGFGVSLRSFSFFLSFFFYLSPLIKCCVF